MNLDDKDSWQTRYTLEDAHSKDMRRILAILLPVFLGLLIFLCILILFTIIYPQSSIFIILTSILILLLGILICTKILGTAKNFLVEFYHPDSNLNLTHLILLRLFGIPPLPPPFKTLWKYPWVIVKEGKLDVPNHWASWLGGPALLIIYDNTAVYLERGNQFSRVVGSGRVFLERHETIRNVVDLRPQSQDGVVKAWTRDGIRIEVEMYLTCRIGIDETQNPEEARNYPCDPLAVRRVVENTAVRLDKENGLVETKWLDGAWGRLRGLLANYIASHRIDELIHEDISKETALSSYIEGELLTSLIEELKDFGVTPFELHIKRIKLPPNVENLLVETWESKWKNYTTVQAGISKANQERIHEKAWLEAQRNLIDAIEEGLEKMDTDHFAESFLLSLSGVLERSLADSVIRNQMTEKAFETLEQFKDLVYKDKDFL